MVGWGRGVQTAWLTFKAPEPIYYLLLYVVAAYFLRFFRYEMFSSADHRLIGDVATYNYPLSDAKPSWRNYLTTNIISQILFDLKCQKLE